MRVLYEPSPRLDPVPPWTDWHGGGGCPVVDGKLLEVKFAAGIVAEGFSEIWRVYHASWDHSAPDRGDWIIAYRVIA